MKMAWKSHHNYHLESDKNTDGLDITFLVLKKVGSIFSHKLIKQVTAAVFLNAALNSHRKPQNLL